MGSDRIRARDVVAEQEASGLIQMYQAGFLDGFNWTKGKDRKFEKIKEICKKAFEFRFMKKLKLKK